MTTNAEQDAKIAKLEARVALLEEAALSGDPHHYIHAAAKKRADDAKKATK